MVFGYEGPFSPAYNRIDQQILSHRFVAQSGGANAVSPRPKTILVVGAVTDPLSPEVEARVRGMLADGLPDPGAPKPGEYARRESPPLTATTLKDAVAVLNYPSGQTPGRERKPISALVESELAPKPICMVGAEHVVPAHLMTAFAAVYGLEIHSQENGTLTLALPNPHLLRNYREVPGELDRLFPKPWRRAVTGVARQEMVQLTEIEARRDIGSGGTMPIDPLSRSHMAGRNAQGDLYAEALRLLRALVEPQVAAAEHKRLKIADSGEDAKRLLALSTIADQLSGVDGLIRAGTPRYITDFAAADIQGQFDREGRLTGFLLGFKDKSGLLRDFIIGIAQASTPSP
jgi:hypothetical protein